MYLMLYARSQSINRSVRGSGTSLKPEASPRRTTIVNANGNGN